MMNFSLVFAQAAATSKPVANQTPPSLFDFMPLMIAMFAIIYFLMIRPQSKDRKKRESMLGTIKKNDRIITIGGIIGTVTSVRDDEITLKVDESSNTKITFAKSAIQRIIMAGPSASSGAESEPVKEKK